METIHTGQAITKSYEFTVVYQTGGSENAQWHRTALRGTRQEMNIEQAKLIRMGYKSYVELAKHVDSIGLPEGYSPLTFTESRNAELLLKGLSA